jgi:hypothetical protein
VVQEIEQLISEANQHLDMAMAYNCVALHFAKVNARSERRLPISVLVNRIRKAIS